MKKLIILTIFLAAFNLEAYTYCEVSEKNCKAYICHEKERGCGKKGYFLKFGYKYCKVFKKKAYKYSPEGREWLVRVRTCLQEELNSIDTAISCRKQGKLAFNSHVNCYVETGFCELSRKDKFILYKQIKKQALNPKALDQAIKIQRKCAKEFNIYE